MGKVWLRFITEEDFSSRLIRWFTWSDWSHVDFVLRDGRFLGARLDGGVLIRPHDYIVPSAFRYAYVEVPDPRKVYGWATTQVGSLMTGRPSWDSSPESNGMTPMRGSVPNWSPPASSGREVPSWIERLSA